MVDSPLMHEYWLKPLSRGYTLTEYTETFLDDDSQVFRLLINGGVTNTDLIVSDTGLAVASFSIKGGMIELVVNDGLGPKVVTQFNRRGQSYCFPTRPGVLATLADY